MQLSFLSSGLAAVVFASLATVSNASDRVLMACGVDSPFYDHFDPSSGVQDFLEVGHVVSCQIYCDQTSGCLASVWSSYANGTCWFKSQMNLIGVPKSDAISASFVTPGVLTPDQLIIAPFDDCDMEGNDISSQSKLPSPAKCGPACVQLKDCWAWSWTNYNGGTCWFKNQASACVNKKGAKSSYVWKYTDQAGNCLGTPATDVW